MYSLAPVLFNIFFLFAEFLTVYTLFSWHQRAFLWKLFWILFQVNHIIAYLLGQSLEIYCITFFVTSLPDSWFSLTLCVDACMLDKVDTSPSLHGLVSYRRRPLAISLAKDSRGLFFDFFPPQVEAGSCEFYLFTLWWAGGKIYCVYQPRPLSPFSPRQIDCEVCIRAPRLVASPLGSFVGKVGHLDT